MASLKLHLLVLTLSILYAAALPPPLLPQSIRDAAETLADSGYTAMSLTLQLIQADLRLPTTSLTIFSPSDAAFASAGQPSLAHLLLHFSTSFLSPSSLLSLSKFSTIPSLSPARRLTVTSNRDAKISINNVGICISPVFNDGIVIVYVIDDFFDLSFTLNITNSSGIQPFQCLKLEPISRFEEASSVLKSRGFSVVASFLESQLIGFVDPGLDAPIKWTVFAPLDEGWFQFHGDFVEYVSVFMRHLAGCKVGWSDMEEIENGSVVSNNVKGFSLVITRDDDADVLMVNGVEIMFPEMYDNGWLTIHGIRRLIDLPIE